MINVQTQASAFFIYVLKIHVTLRVLAPLTLMSKCDMHDRDLLMATHNGSRVTTIDNSIEGASQLRPLMIVKLGSYYLKIILSLILDLYFTPGHCVDITLSPVCSRPKTLSEYFLNLASSNQPS